MMLKIGRRSRRFASISTSLEALYSSTPTPVDALYKTISRAGDPRVLVIPIIEQFVQHGGTILQHQLIQFIKEFRKYKRYKHALEISRWMIKKCHNDPRPGDLSVHLHLLSKEMKQKEIKCDSYTYNIRLNAYASSSDIEGLYAKLGNKDEVYRIWSLYTGMNKQHNSGYLIMISSLAKLDDINDVEKIYKEWDLGSKTCFDIRVPNLLVSVYGTQGHLERAKAVLDGLIQAGKDPNASSLERLAIGYYTCKPDEKACMLLVTIPHRPNKIKKV
ncbi:hypothetical protein QQ045_012298 [Rhodiola kirilowii]